MEMALSRSFLVKVVLLVSSVLLLSSMKACQATFEFGKTSLGRSSVVSAVECWDLRTVVRGAEYCADMLPSHSLSKVTAQCRSTWTDGPVASEAVSSGTELKSSDMYDEICTV